MVSFCLIIVVSAGSAETRLAPASGSNPPAIPAGPTVYTVTFTAKGLPTTAAWTVTLGSTTNFSTSATLTFSEPSGTYPYTVGEVPAYSASPASGNVTISGAAKGVTIDFTGEISHVVVITMESYDLDQILADAPYQHYLLDTYGNSTNYYSECHGSLPNYIGETSGWYAPCGSTPVPISDVSNIGDTLQAAGLSWKGYFEGMPTACDTTSGKSYVTDHNPFLDYTDIRYNSTRCDSHLVNSAAFNQSVVNGTLPAYSYYIPNDYDDCHSPLNGSPASTELPFCDKWLKGFLSPILNSTSPTVQALLAHTAIFIEYDESPGNLFNGYEIGGITNPYCLNETGQPLTVCGGHITLTAISPYSLGTRELVNATDFSELSTVEYLLDVPSDGGYDGSPYFPPLTCLFAAHCTTFTESGLPAGTTWTVSVSGEASESGESSSIVFYLTHGSYTYAVTNVTGYTTTPSGSFTVRGTGTEVNVSFYPVLQPPATPSVAVTTMGVGQTLNVTDAIPLTGEPPYSWTWLTSVAGGAYASATQCTVNSGSGGASGEPLSCSIPGNTLTAGDTYSFKLQITDSAYYPETTTSPASATVTVTTAPAVSATLLDLDQYFNATGTLPQTGTAPYSWTWLVSTDGSAYATATLCSMDHGTGGALGATVTCSIPGGTLTANDSYAFELQYTSSSVPPVTQTTVPSSSVAVASALRTPVEPVAKETELDRNHPLTVTGTVVSSGTAPLQWEWLESENGSGYVPTTQCTVNRGTGPGALVCTVPTASLTVTARYTFELQVTDSAQSPETRTSPPSAQVTVHPAFSPPGAPSVSATFLDANQKLTVSDTLAVRSGNPPYTWTWLIQANGGGYLNATQCEVDHGTGAAGGQLLQCVIPSGTLTPGDTYHFKLLLNDSATPPATRSTTASVGVKVEAELSAPATPTVTATQIDVNQALTISGVIPNSGGSGPYAWTWLVSVNGGSYGPESQCAINGGTGANGGRLVSCAISKNVLAGGDTYAFELEVNDSASAPESATSGPSPEVYVATAPATPAAPSVSATKLDLNQVLNVTDTIPSSGTSPYSWTWLVATNGGSFLNTTQCAVNGGAGASLGSEVTCSIGSGELVVGDSYEFELQVGDGANVTELRTSGASSKVSVDPALPAPGTPSVSATTLKVGTKLVVTGTLNETDNWAPFAWEWLVSVNGGAYVEASQCTSNSGTTSHGNASITCTIPGGTLTVGDSYSFELEVADSASTPEKATSLASSTVTVVS